MELWIRSQDKMKLVKVNYVYIRESDDHFTMYGETIDSGPIIGIYRTKKRALNVLDEIQKVIRWIQKDMKNTTMGDFQSLIGNFDKYVYEMPEG